MEKSYRFGAPSRILNFPTALAGCLVAALALACPEQLNAAVFVEVDGGGDANIAASGSVNNDLILVLNPGGTTLVVSDPNDTVTAGPGATQAGPDVNIPVANIIGGDIVVTAGDGDDRLTIDNINGPLPFTVIYDGEAQFSTDPGDTLRLLDGVFAQERLTFIDETSGTIELGSPVVTTINYLNLEPIMSSVTATDVSLQFSGVGETITFTDAGGGETTVDSTAGEITTFLNPTDSIAIFTDGGNDIINLDGIGAGMPGFLLDAGPGADDLNINGDPDCDDMQTACDTVRLNASAVTAVDELFFDQGVVEVGAGTSAEGVDLITGSGTTIFGLRVDLNGTAPGTDYDQLMVAGGIDIDSATLEVRVGFTPTPGDTFTIIDADFIDGGLPFFGLPDGSLIHVGSHTFEVDYPGSDVDLIYVSPAVPTNVVATGNHLDESVDVTWDTSANATGYLVFRNTSNSHAGETQIAGPIPATAFPDTTAMGGNEYFYWIKAVNGVATSDYSAVTSLPFGPLQALSPWKAQLPLGSLTYRAQTDDEGIAPPGDADRIEATLQAGEMLSVLVQPDPTLRPAVEVTAPNGSSLGTSTASANGDSVAVQGIDLAVSGVYTIAISGVSGTTGDYDCNVAVNAGFEDEVVTGTGNDTPATAQAVDCLFGPAGTGGGSAASIVALGGLTVHPPFYTNNFNSGLSGFTVDNTVGSSNGLWHGSTGRSADGLPNHSPTGSLYYGQGETATGGGDFDTGGANGGITTSPLVMVPDADLVFLRFNHLLDTEGTGSGFDAAEVLVGIDGDFQPIATTTDNTLQETGDWEPVTLDISGTSGETIAIRFSFDTVDNISNEHEGWYIDDIELFTADRDADVYRFTLSAGQPASLAVSALPEGPPSTMPPDVELLDSAGGLLTTGVEVDNADAYIGPIVPSPGATFYALVRSEGFYQLHLTKDMLFETVFPGARLDITDPGIVQGHTGSGVADTVGIVFQAAEGDNLVLETETPGDGPAGISFDNELDPFLFLFDGDLSIVASNDNAAADGKNALLNYTVPAGKAGEYLAAITGSNGTTGEYVLAVAGQTASTASFEVLAMSPEDGSITNAVVTEIGLLFSGNILAPTLDAGDLMVNGSPATSVTLGDDGNIAGFTFASTGDGLYTVTLAAGAVQRIDGTPVDAYTGSFTVDTTGPVLTSGSIDLGSTVSDRDVTFTATFNELLDTNSINDFHIFLTGATAGAIANVTTTYDTGSSTLNVTFAPLPEDTYTLTLISGGLDDPAQNALDGEPLGAGADGAPTGDGTPGGHYVVNFTVEYGAVGYGAFTALPPLGSLVYDPPVTATISPASDVDIFLVDLDTNQTLTVVVDPAPGLQPSVLVLDPSSSPLGTAAAAGAGQDAVLQTLPVASAGTYRVAVAANGASSTGDYAVEILLNAAAEGEDHDGSDNDTVGTAQDLSGAFIALGDGTLERAAVVGHVGSAAVPIANFEAGLDGFTIDNAFGFGGGLWHRSSGRQADGDPTHSPPFSMYFGTDETATGNGTYGNDATGAVYSAQVAVPATGADLAFSSFLGAEDCCDIARVAVSTNGLGGAFMEVASSLATLNSAGAWTTETIDMGAFAGELVNVRFSFKSDFSVTDEGWYVDDVRLLTEEADHYVFLLGLADVASLVVESLDGGAPPLLELLDSSGTVLATGSDAGSRAVIEDFLTPVMDVYLARVTGLDTRYNLIVIRNGGFEPPEDNGNWVTAPVVNTAGRMLGHLTPGVDYTDSIATPGLSAGDAIVVETWTPGDGPLDVENLLDPQLELRGPSFTVVAADSDGAADGRNARLAYLAAFAGHHVVSVLPQGLDAGEYVVRIGTIDSTQDNDNDNLSDAWEFVHGMSTNDDGTVVVTNGPAGDQDMDGANNEAEETAGTNPNDANSVFRIVDKDQNHAPEAHIVTFNTVPGKLYAFDYTDGNGDGTYTWNAFHDIADGVGTYAEIFAVERTFSLLDDFSFRTTGGAPADDWRAYRVRLAETPQPELIRYDGEGFEWIIHGDGTVREPFTPFGIGGGPVHAFDVGLSHAGVPDADIRTGVNARQLLSGVHTNDFHPVEVLRRVYVSPTGSFARWLDIVHNPTGLTEPYTVLISSDLGSDFATTVFGTSSGDSLIDTNDNWIVTDDAVGIDDPTVIHVIAGPGGQRPAFVGIDSESPDVLFYDFNLMLAPGETKIVMYFAAQDNTGLPSAFGKANDLMNLVTPDALEGISDGDRARIVNFNVPLQ